MALKREHAALSSDLDDPSAVPDFLWDQPMTVAELRARRRTASPRKGRASWGRSCREVLEAFFRKEQRFFLSGGAALVGFHLGHRETDDLELFVTEDVLEEGLAGLGAAVRELGQFRRRSSRRRTSLAGSYGAAARR